MTVEREKVRDRQGRWVLGPPKSEHGVRTIKVTPQPAEILRRHVEVAAGIEPATTDYEGGWRVF
jgi:hypothetical protein